MNRRGLVLLGVLSFVLVACSTRTIVTVTGNPTDPVWWRTEVRRTWYWLGIPVGQSPRDIFFKTRERCEIFRRAHTYTRIDEECEPVHATTSERPCVAYKCTGD